jgi:predicted nucleic acid-binding protein
MTAALKAKVVVLDTRALEVSADRKSDPRAAELMRHLLDYARRTRTPVRVPTAVLSEAYRDNPSDAGIDRVLGDTIKPITLGQSMARRAGGLKYRDKLNSCHTVDAVVVATAIRLGGGIIATGDPDDLKSLARSYPNIEIYPLS